jgi:nucleoside phosphorylase
VATWAEALPLVGLHPNVTGMGAHIPVLAGYDAVLSAGFAGACQPWQRPGDLVAGRLETLDHIASPAEKAALGRTGAEAVDMESRWLAEAAAAASLPFASVRVIVDRVQDRAVSLATATAYPRAAIALRRAVHSSLALWERSGVRVPPA